jgi:hypothetical protein
MLRRKRQPAEDRTHLIRQDALLEGNASVRGMPTLFPSGLGRTLLSWVSSVMENCVLPSSRHDKASYQPSAGSPFRPGKPKPKVPELAASTKAEEKLQPVQRLDSEELPLIDLDSEQREVPTPLVLLEDASLQSQLLRLN